MVSGPMCGKMFADVGAEVIEVEPPRRRRVFAGGDGHLLRRQRSLTSCNGCRGWPLLPPCRKVIKKQGLKVQG
jgi:hypothetical protein